MTTYDDRPLLPAEARADQPVCRYCAGRGYWTGGDDFHTCWCVREQREREEDRVDEQAKGRL